MRKKGKRPIMVGVLVIVLLVSMVTPVISMSSEGTESSNATIESTESESNCCDSNGECSHETEDEKLSNNNLESENHLKKSERMSTNADVPLGYASETTKYTPRNLDEGLDFENKVEYDEDKLNVANPHSGIMLAGAERSNIYPDDEASTRFYVEHDFLDPDNQRCEHTHDFLINAELTYYSIAESGLDGVAATFAQIDLTDLEESYDTVGPNRAIDHYIDNSLMEEIAIQAASSIAGGAVSGLDDAIDIISDTYDYFTAEDAIEDLEDFDGLEKETMNLELRYDDIDFYSGVFSGQNSEIGVGIRASTLDFPSGLDQPPTATIVGQLNEIEVTEIWIPPEDECTVQPEYDCPGCGDPNIPCPTGRPLFEFDNDEYNYRICEDGHASIGDCDDCWRYLVENELEEHGYEINEDSSLSEKYEHGYYHTEDGLEDKKEGWDLERYFIADWRTNPNTDAYKIYRNPWSSYNSGLNIDFLDVPVSESCTGELSVEAEFSRRVDEEDYSVSREEIRNIFMKLESPSTETSQRWYYEDMTFEEKDGFSVLKLEDKDLSQLRLYPQQYYFSIEIETLEDADNKEKSIGITGERSRLNINLEGEGSVMVNNEEIIDDTSLNFGDSQLAQLEALPDENWFFEDWTGDYTGTEEEIKITMDEDKEITAQFSRPDVELAIDDICGEGTVKINGEEVSSGWSSEYSMGTSVILAAEPADGYEFEYWYGDGITTISDSKYELTLYSDREISAMFNEIPQLTVEVSGNGYTNPSEGTYEYDLGEEVTISANPSFGWKFSHWGGDITDYSSTTTVEMDEDKTINAYFVPDDIGGGRIRNTIYGTESVRS